MLSCLPPHLSRAPLLPLRERSTRLILRKIHVCRDTEANISKYREAFARRMAMAGLKPNHRIALGVSGGPDSMALCVLAAVWKADGAIGVGERSGWIDGILGIVIDHKLRPESSEEANIVRDWVSRIGIRCVMKSCEWLDGKPKPGHLQKAARDMRYQILQDTCIQNQIGTLLVAHHADDQAELFIIRLSRNSGVLGLAGMAFASQLFSSSMHDGGRNLNGHGILLVRPLLEFSKEDMYKICQDVNQEWLEDPSNKNLVFARNRIRTSLRNFSCASKSELQAIISACRKTRSFVDHICCNLINHAVTIVKHGYAVIDLKNLDPCNIEDLCLSKIIAVILQFISQRHRPIRSSVAQLLLNYIRDYPCKTSLTAVGCYLCPAPGSKGTKILVCYSSDSPQPSKMETRKYYLEVQNFCPPSEIEPIIMAAKLYCENLPPDIDDVPFLRATSSDLILKEAKKLNILSESTFEGIVSLQREESKHFKDQKELQSDCEKEHQKKPASCPSENLRVGQCCHFMNRFFIGWNLCEESTENRLSTAKTCFSEGLQGRSQNLLCRSCVIGQNRVAVVRDMVDADWLYLAKLSRGHKQDESCSQLLSSTLEQNTVWRVACLDYAQLSAQTALKSLKFIPVSARRALPVLVGSDGMLLSIPTVCFKHCPRLSVYSEFKPRVPLGGGYSSYI